ncbi:MAG: DegT/DnrJ/EryC1/StrS family aminotransferase [Candidatus Latescibacteria bacterium]|nr:DegT/DnrJ/EryC1/StrS family aminotransferase [Candidatus Latescibacterota bacterium]
MKKQIWVTQPTLAPLSEVIPYLESIWETGVMTHNGPLMQQLESNLCSYLNVSNMVCVANGTCAMQIAIRALDLTGEIITTPFTFIATANIITWERCRPVFVDINPDTWTIDPHKIEEAITENTSAILPVHVFSAPCDVELIEKIAEKHQLKVVYDAAHAMAVKYKGHSVLSYGDISCVSFHATKLFNTAEGGGCVAKDPDVSERLRRLRFFGFNDNKDIVDDGMNAKMTEVNAALGLANLRHIDETIRVRKYKYNLYLQLLSELPFLTFQKINPESYNYSYMPVLFDSEEILLEVSKSLIEYGIMPRRYFYPSLSSVQLFQPLRSLPIAERVSKCILCLPLYTTLSDEDIEMICELIKKCV